MCRNAINRLDIMLSESEASAFPTAYEKADSSAAPQNDILPQLAREKSSYAFQPYLDFNTSSSTDSSMNSLGLRLEAPGLFGSRVARNSVMPSRPVRKLSEMLLVK